LPSLVKDVIGGNSDVANAYLAIFSVAVAIGSGLASWLCHGRIVLVPTLIGAILLGLFALDLGWTTYGIATGSVAHEALHGIPTVFTHRLAIHLPIDLAGLALPGRPLTLPPSPT